MKDIITSRENGQVRNYALLAASRKARAEQGLFVTEGIKLTCEALEVGYEPIQLFVTDDVCGKHAAFLERAASMGGRFFCVADSVAEKLAQSVTPQGIFGVFRKPPDREPIVRPEGRYLLLSSLQDPGNLGTILRTAAAFGIDGIYLSEDCPDLYSLKVLRASMGGVFKLAVGIRDDLGDAVCSLKEAGVRVYAAALHQKAETMRPGFLGAGCAVMIGNEGGGLPPELVEACGGALLLPMRADSESLNAAMAAGIFLWEMTRQ